LKPTEIIMFASNSLLEHLVRGVLAAGMIAGTFYLLAVVQTGWALAAGLALAGAAVFLMRGCPMCWTMGLIETIRRRSGATMSSR
jgi:Na+-transporting NADH:ubiquinone oxidoreductase subunit NqrD